MAKKEKETPAEEVSPAQPLVEVLSEVLDAPTEETFEQRRERAIREEFIRRNEEAIAARKAVLLDNSLIDDTAGIDPLEAMKRCCS